MLATTHTCAEVSLCQGLQDGVHGPHVEDETQLGHAHGDEAQQENGAEDTLHEGLSCRGNERGEVGVRSNHFANTSGFLLNTRYWLHQVFKSFQSEVVCDLSTHYSNMTRLLFGYIIFPA